MLDELADASGCIGHLVSARWFLLLLGIAVAVGGFFTPTWTIAFWAWVVAATLIVAGVLTLQHTGD